MSTTPVTEALAYAARGWRVFPCRTIRDDGACSCGNPDCQSPGKHPLTEHGFQDATSDKKVIFDWWERWPKANIGIATGPDSGLVLDVDADHGGEETLRDLEAQHGPIPATPVSLTGGGGRHIIFAYPDLAEGETVRNRAGIAPGLDIRSLGGYIIAPPSLHSSGRRYAWDVENGPDTPLAPLPGWLRAMVVSRVETAAPAEPVGDVISAGKRNTTLASLAGSMRHRGASEGAIYAAVSAENAAKCDPPLSDSEVQKIAASIGGYEPAPEPEHLTDLGNSNRWGRQHADDARWCAPLGGWFLWDGQRWLRDARGATMERAKRTALTIYGEVETAATLEKRKAVFKWAVASEGAFRLKAMLELSKSALPAEVAEFDRDPWLLNVQNGVIDLHSGAIREPRREDMISKLAPVIYDPDAQDDVFDAFLLTVTDGDGDLAAWLQRAIGYSITGDVSEEIIIIVLGPTATGKSTLLYSVKETLGDYGQPAGIETFLQHRVGGADTARTDVTALRGARFVVATEAPKGRRMDEPLVKAISGGDEIRARTLYQEAFSFYPQCKLWFGSNFAPQMNNLDDAIWRRLRRVPFETTFASIDPQIKAYLLSSADAHAAILAWAVKGCLAWQRDGLGQATVVERKTAQLRLDMNPLVEFVDARCVLGPALSVDAATLRSNYADWARDTGARPISNQDWGAQLQALGCQEDRQTVDGRRRRLWRGIGLAAGRPSRQDEEPDTE